MNDTVIPVIFQTAARSPTAFFHPSLFHLPVKEADFLHYHDVLEIGMCISGSGVCCMGNDRIPYTAGDAQLFLPFQPHYDIATEEGTQWTFINIDVPKIASPHLTPDPAYLIELTGKIRVSGIFHREEDGNIWGLIRDIVAHVGLQNASESPTVDLIAAKLTALLIELSTIERANTTLVENARRTEIILPAITLTSKAVSRQKAVNTKQMADACFMSESYFRHVFSSIMGESPRSFVRRTRIQKAAGLLLTTNLPVSEISAICGFEDQSTFYRSFIRIYGVSPKEYRKK